MRKAYLAVCLVSLFAVSNVFADDMDNNSKPCMQIAKACLKAGYTRQGDSDKKFWFDCMKPLILGHTVKDVTIDSVIVKACRTDKITDMKKELQEFESVSSN